MGVQVFGDRNDRQFWVIGSALDVNPAAMVLDVQGRCRPASIKFVMITSVESLWARMLAPYFFHRYLRPELALVRLDEINTLMSVSPPDLAAAVKAMGTVLDRQRTDLLTEVHVVTSLRDIPMLADYADRKLLDLHAKITEYDMLQDSTIKAIQGAMSSLRTIEAARRD